MQKSRIIYGKHDQDLVRREMDNEIRLERIKAVRQQESMASQSAVISYQQQKEREQEEQEK
jgi:hypothetical protein